MSNVIEARVRDHMKFVRNEDVRFGLTSERGLQLRSDEDVALFRASLEQGFLKFNLNKMLDESPDWALRVRGAKWAPRIVRQFARDVMPRNFDLNLQMLAWVDQETAAFRTRYFSDTPIADVFATWLSHSAADLVHLATGPDRYGRSQVSMRKDHIDIWLSKWREEISSVYAGSFDCRSVVNELLQTENLNVLSDSEYGAIVCSRQKPGR